MTFRIKKFFKKVLNIYKDLGLADHSNTSANVLKVILILCFTATINEIMYGLNVEPQTMAMLYLLAVMSVSASTPYWYGICAAALVTLLHNFQLVDRRFEINFTMGLPLTLLIMLFVTLVISSVTSRIREKARISAIKEQQAKKLYEINQKLLSARSLGTIRTLTEEYLISHLDRPSILYVSDPSEDGSEYCNAPANAGKQARLLHTPEQIKKVHRMFRTGKLELELPFMDEDHPVVYNFPISSKDVVLGVIGVACGNIPMDPSDRTIIRVVAGQVALALELQHLADEQAKAVLETEKEKTRSTLLRSISHDLRTPLTSILGASSAIYEQGGLSPETVRGLAKDIKTDAQWLIRMVENILMLTRISGESLKVKKQPEAAEEVVSEAVSIVRKRFPSYIFHVQIPDKLLLVPMDITLISQVLINLLENAAKNSPDGSLILVDLRRKDAYAEFDIIDNGPGIPENILDNLFESSAFNSSDASRGTGLGLSICKTIIHAHGGTIEGWNREKQGSEFCFRLPLQEVAKTDE